MKVVLCSPMRARAEEAAHLSHTHRERSETRVAVRTCEGAQIQRSRSVTKEQQKGPPADGPPCKDSGVRAWIRSRSPKLPATAQGYTSNSCSSAPIRAAGWSGCTDPAEV